MNDINHIKHTRFVQNVLGIEITLEDTCLLMEGILPNKLKEQILLETAIYEGFLEDLVNKIGDVPKTIAKTFIDAKGVLTFLYNVLSDTSGENLKKGTTVLLRNTTALFTQVQKMGSQMTGKIKEVFNTIIEWMRAKVKSILGTQSDTNTSDNVKGDGANWKKFLLLFLAGMTLIFLKSIPTMLKEFGQDVVEKGLDYVWKLSQELITKFMSSPADLLKLVSGGALVKILLPLITAYKSAKLLQSINNDLLDSNAWLRKPPAQVAK